MCLYIYRLLIICHKILNLNLSHACLDHHDKYLSIDLLINDDVLLRLINTMKIGLGLQFNEDLMYVNE